MSHAILYPTGPNGGPHFIHASAFQFIVNHAQESLPKGTVFEVAKLAPRLLKDGFTAHEIFWQSDEDMQDKPLENLNNQWQAEKGYCLVGRYRVP